MKEAEAELVRLGLAPVLDGKEEFCERTDRHTRSSEKKIVRAMLSNRSKTAGPNCVSGDKKTKKTCSREAFYRLMIPQLPALRVWRCGVPRPEQVDCGLRGRSVIEPGSGQEQHNIGAMYGEHGRDLHREPYWLLKWSCNSSHPWSQR